MGEADILPSRDCREAHHQVPGRQPRQLPLRPGQQMLQQGPGRADSHQTGEKRVRTRVSRRGISPAQCLHLYRQDQRSRHKEGREKARHQPSDELSGRALRHPQEPHPGPPRIHALCPVGRCRKRLPSHARKGLQHHIRRPADGRHLLLPEFPQSRDRLQLRQGVQPLHRLSVRASPLGRDGLHRPAGRHPDDREPGAMAEGLQTVDSGPGGLRTERRGHEPARHHPLQRAGKGKEQLDSAPAAARVERVLLQRHNRPEQQGRCPPARHANHHQHGGVRRREARRAGSIEANHRAGQRDTAQGLRHRSLHPAPPLLLHREHQQPAVPAGHRRKPAFPPHHHHRYRLPHPGEPSRHLRPGPRLAERRFQILVRGRGDRTVEQAQRTAPHERPRGGEPLRLLPQTAARGPAGKMAPCQRHTDQAQHIREGAGEPAHPAGTGAGTGKVRIRHTDQRAGDDRI